MSATWETTPQITLTFDLQDLYIFETHRLRVLQLLLDIRRTNVRRVMARPPQHSLEGRNALATNDSDDVSGSIGMSAWRIHLLWQARLLK